jgi:hypothetical protein
MAYIVNIFKQSLDAILTLCREIVFNFVAATTEEVLLWGTEGRRNHQAGQRLVCMLLYLSRDNYWCARYVAWRIGTNSHKSSLLLVNEAKVLGENIHWSCCGSNLLWSNHRSKTRKKYILDALIKTYQHSPLLWYLHLAYDLFQSSKKCGIYFFIFQL